MDAAKRSLYSWIVTAGIINKSENVMGGTTVFDGTRVPVETLLDYLEGGDSIDTFLNDFPTVKHEQVIKFLESVRKDFLPNASSE